MRQHLWLSICGLIIALTACVAEPMSRAADLATTPIALPAAPVGSRGSQPAVARELSATETPATAELLYQERCATCHDAGRAPPRSQIAANTPQEILEAMNTGFMAAVALFMTPEQKTTLARYLSETR